jgi:hypothetical protein
MDDQAHELLHVRLGIEIVRDVYVASRNKPRTAGSRRKERLLFYKTTQATMRGDQFSQWSPI